MDLKDFKDYVRESRAEYILPPRNLVYESFILNGFDKNGQDFFFKNASYIIERLRESTWKRFLSTEKYFTAEMLKSLIDKEELDSYSKIDGLINFIDKYAKHSYSLALSNTQSRRSRAGSEFEYMIELVLMGANIPFDTQGSVGAGVFETTQLAKLVDCVTPGANEYRINKRNTSLISAKTTLRERWQEVGDEMSRTRASEMYLATLDDSITDNTLTLIGTNNIIIVTTDNLKNRYYKNNHYVITFETMLSELSKHLEFWEKYNFTEEELAEKTERYQRLIREHEGRPFVTKYYKSMISSIKDRS